MLNPSYSTQGPALDPRLFSTGRAAAYLPLRLQWHHVAMASPRFLTLADVAEVLNTSSAQVYALVRRGDLPAIKIGGRGQWRVEGSELEKFIERMYDETKTFVSDHPFVDSDTGRTEG